jgi:hypothetical protein
MPKLKTPMSFETTFGTYMVDELVGEGGAGRVYDGVGIDRSPIALKILARTAASTDTGESIKALQSQLKWHAREESNLRPSGS